jgi:hypothetical protein
LKVHANRSNNKNLFILWIKSNWMNAAIVRFLKPDEP